MVAAAVGAAGVASSIYGANKSSSSAKSAEKTYARTAQAELDFAMRRYDDWQRVFGPMQETLANYYSNLTPEFIEAQGLEDFELEKDIALTNLRETFAQRGISDSGLAADVETKVALASASERAKIRAEAPLKTAQEQLRFLQVGLGQNPAGDVQRTLAGQTSDAANRSSAASAAAGQAWQSATSSVFDFFANNEQLFQSKKTTTVT